MKYSTLKYAVSGRIARITLNRPARLNAIDARMPKEIRRAVEAANADDKALKNGAVYNVAFAVHDDNMTSRGHHVSFPVKVGFGAKADIEAARLP